MAFAVSLRLTIETCSLQRSSEEYPWSTREMKASSYRFLCLRRSLKQQPRIGTFGLWRRGTIWFNALDYLRDECNAMLAGKATTADEVLARRNNSEKRKGFLVHGCRENQGPWADPARRKTKGSAVLSPCESAAVKASKGPILSSTTMANSTGRVV
jgi:hypothetical protein